MPVVFDCSRHRISSDDVDSSHYLSVHELKAFQIALQEVEEVDTDGELSRFSSWQVPYFCLALVEKAADVSPKQVNHFPRCNS